MDGEAYVFMDSENYEQYHLNPELVENAMKFVRDNQEIHLTFFESNPVAIELPAAVILQIKEAEMAAKGNTVNADKKKAICETGLEVKVPPFIETGEWVKISTETGEFLSRAKKEEVN